MATVSHEAFAELQLMYARLLRPMSEPQLADLRSKFAVMYALEDDEAFDVTVDTNYVFVNHIIVRPNPVGADVAVSFKGVLLDCTRTTDCGLHVFDCGGVSLNRYIDNPLKVIGCNADVVVVFTRSELSSFLSKLPPYYTEYVSTCGPHPRLSLCGLPDGKYMLSPDCHIFLFEDMEVDPGTKSVKLTINDTSTVYTGTQLTFLEYVVPCLLCPVRIDSMVITLGTPPDDAPVVTLSAKKSLVLFAP